MTAPNEHELRVIEVSREDTLATLVERIPSANELAQGTQIALPGGAQRGLVAKLFGRATPLARSIRASALLVRGYRDIEGKTDETGDDLVVGKS